MLRCKAVLTSSLRYQVAPEFELNCALPLPYPAVSEAEFVESFVEEDL